MIPYEIIERAVPRESFYPGRHIELSRLTKSSFGTPEHEAWVAQNWWMVDYEVMYYDKERAQDLAGELATLFESNPNDDRIPILVNELWKLRNKPETRSTLQSWQWTAYQMPDDIGGGFLTKSQIALYLSKKYRGRVLEAMCGFNSYFTPDNTRTVIALDYCREALERYPYPERTRILTDLNQVTDSGHLECFGEEFDTISICFGFRYLERPADVFRELRRYLKTEEGVLSFVENPDHGYEDICRRAFSPQACGKALRAAGFRKIRISKVPISTEGFYHMEAQ